MGQYHSDRLYGIRIGTDISRIPLHFLNDYRTDFSAQVDVRVDSNLYGVGEIGWNNTNFKNKPIYSYKSHGAYLKFGADYNILKPTFPFESNMIYGGIRYGIAEMSREIPEYEINYPFWGDVQGNFSSKSLTPHWVEVVFGMKVEVLNNLFLDWGLHLRHLINGKVDKAARPFIIPGFGKAQTNMVFDFNYNVSYRIPLWEPKPKDPHKAQEKKKKKLRRLETRRR